MQTLDLGENANGTRARLHIDDTFMVVQDVQDVQPILDEVQRKRSLGQAKTLHGGYYLGEVPVTVYYEWRKEWRTKYRQQWDWKTYFRMKWNNRDYSKFKVNDMKI